MNTMAQGQERAGPKSATRLLTKRRVCAHTNTHTHAPTDLLLPYRMGQSYELSLLGFGHTGLCLQEASSLEAGGKQSLPFSRPLGSEPRQQAREPEVHHSLAEPSNSNLKADHKQRGRVPDPETLGEMSREWHPSKRTRENRCFQETTATLASPRSTDGVPMGP